MNNRLHNTGNLAVKPFLFPTEEEAPLCSSVQYCNKCGHSMKDPRSFILEYWKADQTVYFCWCHACGHCWELLEVTTFSATEMGEGEDDF
jgi:hypothetical protein